MGVSIQASDVPIRKSAIHSPTMVEDMDLLWDADCAPQRSNSFDVQIRVASALSPGQPAPLMETPAAETPLTSPSPATSMEKLTGSSSIFERESQSPELSASIDPVQIQPLVLSQAGTAKRRLAIPAQDSSAVASGTTSPNSKKPNDSHASSLKSKKPLFLANKSMTGSAVRRGSLPALDPRGVHIKESGPPGSLVYRGIFLEGSNWDVSPWHSVPLTGPDGLLNCICTTPTGTWVRHELAPDEPNNPLRCSRNAQRTPGHFHANAPWNIALLPQTLSDPSVLLDQSAPALRASCPIEVLDIGATTCRRVGEIYSVKPLAAFAVLPAGSQCVQWKVVAIAAQDPMAPVLEDAADLDMLMPGLLEMVREWLRRPACSTSTAAESLILLNGYAVGLPQVLEVLTGGHEAWQLFTSSLVHSPFALKGPQSPASPIPSNLICPSIPACGPTMGLGLFYEPSLFRNEVGHACTESNVDSNSKATISPKVVARARQELIANLKYLDQRLVLPAFSPHLSHPAVQSLLGSVKLHLRSAGHVPPVLKSASLGRLSAEEIRVTFDARTHFAEGR